MSTQIESAQKIEAQFRVGEWLVEPSLNRVARDGVSVQLELKAMDVLLCLAGRPGELIDKRELVDAVWQTEFVSDNTLTRRIAELRDAFDDDARNPSYIETITKRGYRLIAEVGLADDSLDDPRGALAETALDKASPYPGLSPFTESDAGNFFGRESEITALWRKIAGRRLLAVVGPSGAGKSSLMRAGVIARAPPGWRAVVCQPGEDPILAVARALAPDLADDAGELRQLLAFHDPDIALAVAARWRGRWDEALLVVDQFEELFTLNPESVQESFVALLRRLVDAAGIHAVLVLRDDFLLECHRHPQLAPIFGELTPVGPPPAAELRKALTEPAARHRFGFNSELLVDEMVGEVEAERGALPLLAFAVSRLWEHRDRERRLLTREAYEKIGGVGGALAQHAEATVDAIGHDRLPIVRELFRNLVTAQGTRAARRVEDLLSVFEGRGVRKSEGEKGRKSALPSVASEQLRVRTATSHSEQSERSPSHSSPARAEAAEVLNALVDARLLTSYEIGENEEGPTRRVEIVHESLLRAWPRLVRWQTQDADAAQLRDQLRQAAQLWQARGKSDDLLWAGASYREFALWRERYPGGLTAAEVEFTEAMTKHAQRRLRRRRAVVTTLLLGLLAVAVTVTTLWRRSEHHARRVEAQRLYEIGRRTIDWSPPDALAWSIASLELEDDPEVRLLALQALWRSPMPFVAEEIWDGDSFLISSTFSPNGSWLMTGTADGQTILRRSTGERASSWKGHWGPNLGWFSPDGKRLLTAGLGESEMIVWSVPDATRLGAVPAPNEFLATDTNPGDGKSFIRMMRVVRDPDSPGGWSIGQGPLELRRRLQQGHRPRAALGPDGRNLIYALGPDLMLARTDTPESRPSVLGRCGANVKQIAFHPGGREFAVVDTGGAPELWTLSGQDAAKTRSWQGPASEECDDLRFDPSGRFLAVAYDLGQALIYGLDDTAGAGPIKLQPAGSRMIEAQFDPSGRWITTVSMGRVAFWPWDHTRRPVLLEGHSGPVNRVVFGRGGSFLVSCGTDGTVRQWPLRQAAGVEPRVIFDWGEPIEWFSGWVAVSDDERVVVSTGNENHVRVIPLDGRPQLDIAHSNQRIVRATVSPDGRLAAVAGRFGDRDEIQIWDWEEEEIEAVVEIPQTSEWPPTLYPLEFSDDGSLFIGFKSHLLRWDPISREVTEVVEGVHDFAIDATGRTVIARPIISRQISRTAVYDLESGSSRWLATHGEDVMSLALNSAGTVLATADLRGGVRVGPATGERPHLLTIDNSPVMSAAVSPDGRWVASGHNDGTIRLWPVPDLTKRPMHELPYREFLAKLKSLTNLRVVPDPELSGSQVVRAAAPFPGWETVPEW